jgi:hypothetical protein
MTEVNEALAEEYWERKRAELHPNQRALELHSAPQIPHARPGIEVRPPSWDNG